ncbi:MASE1 domain-containing protein [Pseudomonas aeruginosa]|nr:MASE1 domain-containing protein [Pseudomonas aeruginosa]
MSNSKWAKGVQSRLLELPEGLLVAVLYAAACWSARQVSLDQFFLPAGIRVAALLLCRREMWPYLLVGEYAYFAYLRIPLVDMYGMAWAVTASVYQLPFVAFIVHLHWRRKPGSPDIWLLSIAALAAATTSLGNLSLIHLFWKTLPDGGFALIAFRYAMGDYIAILTAAPLALLWSRRAHIQWSAWRTSSAAYAVFTLFALGSASALSEPGSPFEKATLQLLMAIPVVALTCLQGWSGAAIGVPLMYAFIHIGTPSTGLPASFDSDSFRVQLITAISGTALLALGSRVTYHCHRYLHQAKAGRQAISNARASHLASERELRERVLDLRRISDGLERSLSDTVEWLRTHGHTEMASSLLSVAAVHSRKFREQTSMVYPTTLEHVGLYLALQVGGIGDSWGETLRLAPPQLTGDPCSLSQDLQLATYRALTEAVALLIQHERGKLQIRARSGRFGQASGIVVSVGSVDPRYRIAQTTATMAVGRLSGWTQAYGGIVQCRRNRIRMFFVEETSC